MQICHVSILGHKIRDCIVNLNLRHSPINSLLFNCLLLDEVMPRPRISEDGQPSGADVGLCPLISGREW